MSTDQKAPEENTTISDKEAKLQELYAVLKTIGVGRFSGRINAGLIEPDLGYRCVELLAEREEVRPFASRISHLLTGRIDTFLKGKTQS